MIFPGPLRERNHFSNHYLHYSALDTPVLCPCFYPSEWSVQDSAAAVRWFVNWSLRIAGLSHGIPMLARCIYLEQGHCGRALH